MSNEIDHSTCTVVPAAKDVLFQPSPPPSNKTDAESLQPHSNKNLHRGKRQQNPNNGHRNNHRSKKRRRGNQNPAPPFPPAGCSVCKLVKDNEPPKYKCPKCRASYCSVACCRQHKLVCPGKPGDNLATTDSHKTTTGSLTPATKEPTRATETRGGESGSESDTTTDDDESSLEDGWEITDHMKVALRNSTWLRRELQDGGLRDMIASVVRSEKKHKSYHRNKRKHGRNPNQKRNNPRNQHPRNHTPPPHPHEKLQSKRTDNRNFDVFVDKLLVLADVLERQEGPPEDPTSGTAPSATRNEEELEEWLRQKWEPGIPPPALALKPARKAIPKFEPVHVPSSSEEEAENDDIDS